MVSSARLIYHTNVVILTYMARPAINPENRRTERLWCLVTKKDREKIEAHAQRRGLSVADHLRDLLKKAASGEILVR
jgi:hypothetical protein